MAMLAEDLYGHNSPETRGKVAAHVRATKKLGWNIMSERGPKGSGYIIDRSQWLILVEAFCKLKINWEKNQQLNPANLQAETQL